ncbi:MAG TPA: preprotein translocase subunit YajC [Verrucomicrobiota bacterium]|nr:preprotein translocase subunit YajC [Verrucomicrobiota bacterium]
MHLNHPFALLAQAPSGQQPPPAWTSLVMFIPIIVIFYFLLIRPQQKKAKEHAEMIKTVKAGDKILTTGGIIGIVLNVREKSLTLRSSDTKLEIDKSAIAAITERGGQNSET